MVKRIRVCKHSEVKHLRKFLAYAKLCVNEARYYPPSNDYRYMLGLALYSKCITVAGATIVLLEAGFGDEAFGMTRTLIDLYFTLRYIVNNDTDNRACRYVHFSFKDSAVWAEVARTYWPQKALSVDSRTQSIAATYRDPHKWSGKQIRDMALEPDTFEVDPVSGAPAVHDIPYRVMFRWTSHYVHPSIGALGNHLVQAGRDNFTVRSGNGKDMSNLAALNVAAYVAKTMIAFYRCMGDPRPDRLARWALALTQHIAQCHK